jgi:hypothetical protein
LILKRTSLFAPPQKYRFRFAFQPSSGAHAADVLTAKLLQLELLYHLGAITGAECDQLEALRAIAGAAAWVRDKHKTQLSNSHGHERNHRRRAAGGFLFEEIIRVLSERVVELEAAEAAGFQVAERLAVCRSLVRQLDALALLDRAAVQTDKDVAA